MANTGSLKKTKRMSGLQNLRAKFYVYMFPAKKLPATMRMRRLPKSYWEEPGSKTSTSEASSVPGISNHPLSTIHFSTYTILPPLFSSGGKTDFAAEEILGESRISARILFKQRDWTQVEISEHTTFRSKTVFWLRIAPIKATFWISEPVIFSFYGLIYKSLGKIINGVLIFLLKIFVINGWKLIVTKLLEVLNILTLMAP